VNKEISFNNLFILKCFFSLPDLILLPKRTINKLYTVLSCFHYLIGIKPFERISLNSFFFKKNIFKFLILFIVSCVVIKLHITSLFSLFKRNYSSHDMAKIRTGYYFIWIVVMKKTQHICYIIIHYHYRRFQNDVGSLFVIVYSNINIRPVCPTFVFFSSYSNITEYTILKMAII
jgi:hypothetical protein